MKKEGGSLVLQEMAWDEQLSNNLGPDPACWVSSPQHLHLRASGACEGSISADQEPREHPDSR